MRYSALFIGLGGLLTGCANHQPSNLCQLSEGQQATALDNISAFMEEAPDVARKDYGDDPLHTRTSYDSSDSCTFIIEPVQPVSSQFIWDGAWGFRVDKGTLAVDKYYRIDVK